MVDPKLETNRVRDLGGTVRPSSKWMLIGLGVAGVCLFAFALACDLMTDWPFEFLALLYVLSGQWALTGVQWLVCLVAVVLALVAVAGVWAGVRRLASSSASGGGRHRTRVDSYASAMGYGHAVEKVTRERAERMAGRLVVDYDRTLMAPGYPLGLNLMDGTPMYTSWEDMAIVLAGPRSGKSLCYAIPAVLSAPGACLATSNKGDIYDVTAPVRRLNHPDGRIWVFDPEGIVDPNRDRVPWVWDLIASIKRYEDAKRIADCWRYASGQTDSGDNEYFTGTAARQLADYLFAAHLVGRTVRDVFNWASDQRDSTPADILSRFPRYREIANRVSGVIGLVPETRSGVFGSLQTMVAFLANPEIVDWIEPRDDDGQPGGRPLFDPHAFVTSQDTLYLLSAKGRPSTALTASLTAVVAFSAYERAQSEFTDNNRRLPVPLCCVLDEAANICRWPELSDVYSYFGSAGIPIMTIWQNPDQGKAAFGETDFGSLFNNANITVYLGGIKDARFLGEISQLVGQRDVVRSNVTVDARGSRSVNRTIQQEDILSVSRLAEWPIGRALVLASQSRAQIVATLPWNENRTWTDALAKAKKDLKQGKAA
ncbi:type IV secretory system conjugative DNA transfer family protein [Bifidobacterium sp. UBA4282]|uniref:type IV secretory system conjugative DNA transfer family protein n=1 Tax=Bifidobacterium sp. UBA4282 TaxID=1946096 RepID=UPI0025C17894|nr:type IV secretory system conjugative DNA transfer family protein [Bifidobacterium sp. UBA4282]